MKKPIMWVAALLTASCTPALKVEVANTTPTERDDETVEIAWSEVAALKGRTAVPSQPLALTTALNTAESPFPTAEVDLDLALSYLRRESLPGFPDSPRGPLLLTFRPQGLAAPLPLGFANNLGSRANNLYPTPWRILH